MISVSLSPFSEQCRTVIYPHPCNSPVDGLRKYQAETQKELDALTQSILSKAFKGELQR